MRVADVGGRPGVLIAARGAVVAPEVPGAAQRRLRARGDVAVVLRLGVGGRAAALHGSSREPAHGTVALAPGADGLHAAATYTPAAGFAGEDSFTYVATDARGLTSKPATVRVDVPAADARAAARRLPATCRGSRSVRVVSRRGRWRVDLRASAPARLSGRLERRRGGAAGRTLACARAASRAGRRGSALGRLARGRYRLRLRRERPGRGDGAGSGCRF